MGEIATWAMIHAKIPSSPAPTSGRENECLTKSEITNMGGSVQGNYSNSECVVLDDISFAPVYPCMSETDKTPIGTTITNIYQSKEARIYLSGYIGLITVVALEIGGTPFTINKTISVGESTAASIAGIVSHRGNYITVGGQPQLPANLRSILIISIAGNSYGLKLFSNK